MAAETLAGHAISTREKVMTQRIDPRRSNTLIDANVLGQVNSPEGIIVKRILELNDKGIISLLLPHSVQAEIDHPNTPAALKDRARELIYTTPVSLTPDEIARHQHVRDLVRGEARPGKHDRDAYHMVEAAKYGGYFITRDERLLKRRKQVCEILGPAFAIVTPSEFLGIYDSFSGKA